MAARSYKFNGTYGYHADRTDDILRYQKLSTQDSTFQALVTVITQPVMVHQRISKNEMKPNWPCVMFH